MMGPSSLDGMMFESSANGHVFAEGSSSFPGPTMFEGSPTLVPDDIVQDDTSASLQVADRPDPIASRLANSATSRRPGQELRAHGQAGPGGRVV